MKSKLLICIIIVVMLFTLLDTRFNVSYAQQLYSEKIKIQGVSEVEVFVTALDVDSLYSAEVLLDYDDDLLQVTDVLPGFIKYSSAKKIGDNITSFSYGNQDVGLQVLNLSDKGCIHYAITKIGNQQEVSGTVDIVKFKFKVLDATEDETTITIRDFKGVQFIGETTQMSKYGGIYIRNRSSSQEQDNDESEDEHEDETPSISDNKPPETISGFVKQFYEIALGREVDTKGLFFFVQALTSHKMTAAQMIGYVILESPEFARKDVDGEKFIEILYRILFNRAPDLSGKNFWLNKLNEGYSRRWVLANMIGSPSGEFDEKCNALGIIPGRICTKLEDLPH